jgi:hypothetical protein
MNKLIRNLAVTLFPLFLLGCASAPMPGSGATIGKLSTICSTNGPEFEGIRMFYVYYPNSKIDSTGTICRFEAANIYFPRPVWTELQKALSTFPPDTAVRPMFDELHPRKSIDRLWLVSSSPYNQVDYFMLIFKNGKWLKQPVDKKLGQFLR